MAQQYALGPPSGISASAVMWKCGRLSTRGPTQNGSVCVPGRWTLEVRGSAALPALGQEPLRSAAVDGELCCICPLRCTTSR